jgi:hypothetical protein
MFIRQDSIPPPRPKREDIDVVAAHKNAVPVLLSVVENADNFFLPSVRVTAVEVLATLSSSDAGECLRNLVANPAEDPEVRQAAALTFA